MEGCRCLGCKERTLGCHAWCEAYREFSERCEKERRERARETKMDSYARRW